MDGEVQGALLRAQLRSKATRNPADMELYELSQLSGITMSPRVFEILLNLLRNNVPPEAIVEMLRSMCSGAYQQLQGQAQQNVSLASIAPALATSTATAGAVRANHSLGNLTGNSRSSASSVLTDSGQRRAVMSGGQAVRSSSSQQESSRDNSNVSSGSAKLSRSGSDAFVTTRPRYKSSTLDSVGAGSSTGNAHKRRSYQH